MAAISETLRQARLRSGFDLERLAEKTKINARYLLAIEAGDFAKLPSGSFAKMFVRQYADAVGLDGASVAEEFQRSSSSGLESFTANPQAIASSRSNFHPTVPGLSSVGDRVRNEQLTTMLSSLIWVVAAILVCAAAYYGLAHLPSRASIMTPETAAKPANPPVQARPAPATPPAAAPAAPATATTNPAGAPAKTEPAAGSTPAATPAVAPATASTTPLAPGAIQLSITVSEPVWVTAIADGKTVVSEVVNPGASKIVDASKQARLTLGNAGGAEITFNGKKLEPLGPRGAVRTVDFTPWGAQVLSRTPPNPDPLR